MSVWLLAAITFAFGLVGSLLLVLTPPQTFDILIAWLLLFFFAAMAFGKPAAHWLQSRVAIPRPTLLATQALLGIYGGYFGGRVGLITTAIYGLLANIRPRELFAIRTTMLAVAKFAAAFVFIGFGMVWWWTCLPMLLSAIVGGWLGALVGKHLSHRVVRVWTLLVTGAATITFFLRP